MAYEARSGLKLILSIATPIISELVGMAYEARSGLKHFTLVLLSKIHPLGWPVKPVRD